MFFEKPCDSGCLQKCLEIIGDFEKCYKYCQEHDEFDIPENPEKLNEIGEELDIHPLCLICTYTCKQKYSFWSPQIPPSEYCDKFSGRT